MQKDHRLPDGVDRDGHFVYEERSPDAMNRHLKNVTGSLVKDALDVWADLWEELQGCVTGGGVVLPEADKGYKPSCGWPEFMEKMWLLKRYLDHAKKICDGNA